MKKLPNGSHLPECREKQTKPHKQRVAYAPEGIFKNSTYRRCPFCHSKNVKRNGRIRPNEKYKYRCNSCGKNFTITIYAIDIDRLFAEAYDDYYRDIPYMHNTKYRKIRAFKENKEVRRCFNDCVEEYQVDQGYLDDERDIYAFHIACKLATKLDQQEIDKYCDSWYYLANYNNSDVTYELKYYNNHLACRYDMHFSRVQNIKKPLLHCDKCGSASIVRQGFNNNGRRRIRCDDCKKISLIGVKHLITQQEFDAFLYAYFAKNTHDQELIDSLTVKMRNDYYKIRLSRHFESLIIEQRVITHQLKEDIFNAFIASEYFRVLTEKIIQTLFKDMEYEELYNSCKQITSLPDSKNIIKIAQMFHKNLKHLPDKIDSKDAEHTRLFYQVAAAVHTPYFHDWRHKTYIAFEELKASLPLVKERELDTK